MLQYFVIIKIIPGVNSPEGKEILLFGGKNISGILQASKVRQETINQRKEI